jgi:hypothetical protein
MTMSKAEQLARLIDGEVATGGSVAVTRADGRYALIDEDAGAAYFDDVAATRGYSVKGGDPRGDVDAEEWGAWTSSRRWAEGLARLLGPGAEARETGGNIWVVLFERGDGQLACIGDESGALYDDRVAYDRGEDGSEYFEWI